MSPHTTYEAGFEIVAVVNGVRTVIGSGGVDVPVAIDIRDAEATVTVKRDELGAAFADALERAAAALRRGELP